MSGLHDLREANKCPHCDARPADCPFCGKPGQVFGCATVGCSDTVNCGGQVDFGHWVGDINGRPDVCFVIEQWNKRAWFVDHFGTEQEFLARYERHYAVQRIAREVYRERWPTGVHTNGPSTVQLDTSLVQYLLSRWEVGK